MNLMDKCNYMAEFCSNMCVCSSCPVDMKNPNHTCGYGRSDKDLKDCVPSEEIDKNYAIATGGYRVSEKLKKDAINPSHYKQGGIECIDALKAATINLKGIDAVCTANAIKYLWRWKEKNGLEDLNKAIWYIKRLIKENGGTNNERD